MAETASALASPGLPHDAAPALRIEEVLGRALLQVSAFDPDAAAAALARASSGAADIQIARLAPRRWFWPACVRKKVSSASEPLSKPLLPSSPVNSWVSNSAMAFPLPLALVASGDGFLQSR